MFSLLIAIIYLAFISLGLPDSLLGSAWPVLHLELGVSLSSAGYVSMIISACTIISALFSDRVTRKLGSGRVVAFSTLLTASAMTAFSFSNAFWMLCVFAVPYGLGAGAIDACLNNYVAVHLSSRHMNWLHCCWGIGASISPYLMGFSLTTRFGWQGGYRLVSVIQFALTLVMFLSLPLWKKAERGDLGEAGDEVPSEHLSLAKIFRIRGTPYLFFAFLGYCVYESTSMVWASSFFSEIYKVTPETAAFLGSLFYLGLTLSRAVCGFISNALGDRKLIRIGLSVAVVCAIPILIPFPSPVPAAVGFVLVGFGCGPIYPSIIHSTPDNFGKELSGSIVGVQMAFSYLGFTFSPILFGKLAELGTMRMLPVVILAVALVVFALTERVNHIVDTERAKKAATPPDSAGDSHGIL